MTGKELVAIRKELGMSQAEMADELGVTQQAVSLWEKEDRPIRRPIVKLGRILQSMSGK